MRAQWMLGMMWTLAIGCQRDHAAMDPSMPPEPVAEPVRPVTPEPGQDGVFQGVGSVLVQVRGTFGFGPTAEPDLVAGEPAYVIVESAYWGGDFQIGVEPIE